MNSGVDEKLSQNEKTGFRRPGIVQCSILFSITILLFLSIGYRVQYREFYSGILISEFGVILLPALVFLLLFKFDLRSVLRLNGTKPLNFVVVFFTMLLAIPLAAVFNLLNLLIVNSVFGKVIVQQIPTATNGMELLLNILVIAGSAGICEEFLFRGVLQRGFERFGTVRSILLAAFLFSLTHLDFQKIFGTFMLGALIGFIVYRTNSLYCGMFAHFSNNAVAVLVGYVSTKLASLLQGSGTKAQSSADLNALLSIFQSMPKMQLMIVLCVYGFMFLFMAVIFVLLLYALIRLNPVKRSNRNMVELAEGLPVDTPAVLKKDGVKGLIWLLPGLLLIVGIYLLEVFRFNGISNGLVEFARSLLGAHSK